ncbi:MAG: hypothetical protein AAFN79_07695 [Pseudomonadota bacterium]
MDNVRGLNEAFELAQNALVEAGYGLRDTVQLPRRTEFIYEKNGESLNLNAS